MVETGVVIESVGVSLEGSTLRSTRMQPIGHTWISDLLLSVAVDSHLGTTQPIGHTQSALP